MSKKQVFEFIIRVIIYALSLFLGLLTGCALSSCSSPSSAISQSGIIIIQDTIRLN